MERVSSQESETSNFNSRLLGVSSATSLVIASMIGTGVFTTSGFLLADLHSKWAVVAAWVAGGIMASLGALCYGALARRFPESGGEYLLLTRTVHPAAGYVAGWISLLVGFSAPLAAAAYGFGEYAKSWFHGCPPPVSGTLAILAFATIHAAQVERGARVQDFVVLIKVVLIIALVSFGLGKIGIPSGPDPPLASIPAFGASLVWVSFSYSGWNAAIYIAGEIRDPERNLPRALLYGTGLVALLYIGLNLVFVFSAPASDLAGKLDVGRIAAMALGGPVLAEIVTGLIVLALLTSISSMLMAGPRVYARMAQDGCFPAIFIPRAGPPRRAIALQAIISVALLWSASYESLLTYIGFTLGLATMVVVIGLIRVRLREGESLRVPGWPWVPLLFIFGVAGITAFSILRRPIASLFGLITIAFGLLLWRINASRRSTSSRLSLH